MSVLMDLRRGDELELLLLQAVSGDYFATLGVGAAMGRVIEGGIDRGLPALARGFLHGVSPIDPRTLGVSAAAAIFMGLLASALPAWRAVRTDPASVLRLE